MLSWGYRVNEDYFSSKYLIQSIAKALAMGGNYLLNVGPKPDGTFAKEDIDMLRTIGNWYHSVKVSYTGTEPASYLVNNENILATREGNNLYIHLVHDPKGRAIELNSITSVPLKAVLLNNGQVLTASRDQGARHWKQPLHDLRIRDIPVEAFYDRVMVIKLEFEVMLEAVQEVGRQTGDKARQGVLPEAAGKPGSASHRNPDIP
jgi:alpha-L-fucosidase